MFKPTSDIDEAYDLLFKLVLIGDAGVGKTCLVQRFMGACFVERHSSTIGVDFTMKTITIDNKKIKLQIWDTAGQERFRTITQSYYRSANGVVLAFDSTRAETFEHCLRWYEDVKRYAAPNSLILLVGTKSDMGELRAVDGARALEFSKQHGMVGYVESSAKDNNNVELVFMQIAEELKKLHGGQLEEKATAVNLSSHSPLSTSHLKQRCC